MGSPSGRNSRTAFCINDFGLWPFPGVQKCVKIFELDTSFVRLRTVKQIPGRPATDLAPNWTNHDMPGSPRTGNLKQGEMYHAF
jgi:hypothetical protein